MIGSSYNIQADEAEPDALDALPMTAGSETWNPTFTDHNLCPGRGPYVGRTPYSGSCSLNPDIG
jgi:hypothetical protein